MNENNNNQNHNGLKTLAAVASDGAITFTYIGAVRVKGMPISEITEYITIRLSKGYIKYLVVTVSLIKSMSRKIISFGAVNRYGETP